MSIGGTFFVLFTASFLKPLLSSNQSLQLPAVSVHDQLSNALPFEDDEMDSDGVTNLFLTLRLPQLLANSVGSDLDLKRQFDPWGGKRHPKSLVNEDDTSRKRQFSPWGGKRSSIKSSQFTAEDMSEPDDEIKDLTLLEDKRNFNSWGGKRSYDANESKRNFNSWGGKRGYYANESKRNFNSWGGKRGFNSWGGKRNFNAWGGKRFDNARKENSDDLAPLPQKSLEIGRKRQGFHSWGGKRTSDKKADDNQFYAWGGKRAIDFEPDVKQLKVSEKNPNPYAYIAVEEMKTIH